MTDTGNIEYMKLCIRYRLLSILFSTAAYLIWLPRRNQGWYTGIIVSAGMVTACAVGTFLYKKTFFEEESKIWLLATLVLELGAYGIFIWLSGGLSSPYLWYFAGCVFLMAAAGRYHYLMILATAWCIFCIEIGGRHISADQGFTRSDMNTVIGVLIVSGGFYTLQQYARRLEDRRRESERLNQRLAEENEATEKALRQITDLYDTVNLFTMTNKRQSMDEMARLLARSIAPEGCLLLKLKMEEQQKIDIMSSWGLDDTTVHKILVWLETIAVQTDRTESISLTDNGRIFTAKGIGKGIFIPGVLVMVSPAGKENSGHANGQTLPFYLNIIETVFRDMDMRKSLEEGIIRYEQQRIASEIHDTVIQKLFGISCSLKVLENKACALTGDELSQQLRDIEGSTRLTMQELREAIYGIRFENGNNHSFTDRLGLYLREAQRLNSVRIELNTKGDLSLLTTGQMTVVYRIVCEAVNNGVRHGKAGHIIVTIELGGKGIAIKIKDNGSGFDPACRSSGGHGMKNMYRMVSLMKGTFSVHSQLGQGTGINVFLPG